MASGVNYSNKIRKVTIYILYILYIYSSISYGTDKPNSIDEYDSIINRQDKINKKIENNSNNYNYGVLDSLYHDKSADTIILAQDQVNKEIDQSPEVISDIDIAQKLPINNYEQLAYLDRESLEYEQRKEEAVKKTKTQDSAKKKLEGQTESESTELENQKEQDNFSTSDDVANAENAEDKYTDPYEDYNRGMFDFNKKLDKYIIKPPAQVYSYFTPSPVKYMVTNFYSNLQDITVFLNYILQNDIEGTADTLVRVFLNTTFGILGLINVATDIGYPKKANDFGVTFGKWGMTDSPYFVLPVFGPSTFPRDTIGTAAGGAISFGYYLPSDYAVSLSLLYILNKRANLLSLEKIVDTVADDEYIFVRNSYLDYRNSLIRGEKPDHIKEKKEEKLIEDILSDSDDDYDLDNDLEGLDKLQLKDIDNKKLDSKDNF